MYTKDEEVNPTPLINLAPRRIDDQINEALTKLISDEEVARALFQIGPMKAPGPDGFPARFFQRNWEVLKEKAIKGVKSFFEDGIMSTGINYTTIVLIPKGNNPQSMKDYRPIIL